MLERPMMPREALSRALFRGARIVARGPHHYRLRRGGRSTTIPMVGGQLPVSIVVRIQRDLDIDFRRSPHAARRAAR